MRFLKVLFWLLLGGVIAGFVMSNSEERVSIHLWNGLIADFSLPFLLILAFLAGFLPMLLTYHAARWRNRQRIAGLERALADLRTITPGHETPAEPVYGELLPLEPQPQAAPMGSAQ
jgi:putative membrane protein